MARFSRVGHHFIVGLSGTSLSDLDKRILEELSPAGVLLLKRNFLQEAPYHDWLEVHERLLKAIREYAGKEKIIISIDHEGGRVHRLPPPITHFPEAAKCSANAYEMGKAMAIELRSLGVNVSWSPVCDIHSNPDNPVIGTRAFGSDPQTVADAVSRFTRGLMEHGVSGCAKHFPGHGDTTVDSHKALPILSLSLDALHARELVPFQRLINEGIPLVMTSHILFPNIDKGNPATLSSCILEDLLRKKMGFCGIVVTDDLDMHAVSQTKTPADLSIEALRAGCDLFIVARFPDGTSDKPLAMAHALSKALEKDVSLHAKHLAAKERVEQFISQQVGIYGVSELSNERLQAHQKLRDQCAA